MKHSKGNPDLDAIAADWVFHREAGGLSPSEEREYQAWISADPAHGAAVSLHASVSSAFDRPRNTGQSSALLDELTARARSRRRRKLASLAAVTAAFIVGGALWPSLRNATIVQRTDAKSVVIEPRRQVLPDGSIVELNIGAEIVVAFSDVTRRVLLERGEAHFQVVPSPSRPFVVATSNVEVRAVGTAFSVKRGDGEVVLLVTDGKVAVERNVRSDASKSISLDSSSEAKESEKADLLVEAGNKLVIDTTLSNESSVPVPTAVPTDKQQDDLAWRVVRLRFTDTPLAEAVKMLNRYNQVQFKIAEASLGLMTISGIVRADRTEAFARLLEANFDVVVQRSADTITLNGKR